MGATIFHRGPGRQRFKFAGSSIKSTSVGMPSLPHSPLLAVRNAFTFVSVGYEFVHVAMRRHQGRTIRGTLKVWPRGGGGGGGK